MHGQYYSFIGNTARKNLIKEIRKLDLYGFFYISVTIRYIQCDLFSNTGTALIKAASALTHNIYEIYLYVGLYTLSS